MRFARPVSIKQQDFGSSSGIFSKVKTNISTRLLTPPKINIADSTQKQDNDDFKHSNNNEEIVNLRLDKIEDILNRLCLQNDSLMPLLTITENAPLFMKSENQLKNFQKKLIILEEKGQKNELQLEKLENSVEALRLALKETMQHEISKFEVKFNNISKSVTDNINKMCENEKGYTKILKTNEAKLREDLGLYSKRSENKATALEERLNTLQAEVTEQFKQIDLNNKKLNRRLSVNPNAQSQLGNTASRQNSFINDKIPNDSFSSIRIDMFKEFQKEQEKRFQQLSKEIKDQCEKIWIEIGILQCHKELENDQKKNMFLQIKIQDFPQNFQKQQKILIINNLEKSFLLEELENFNTNNTQRIINSLKIITDRNESIMEQANGRLSKLDPNSDEIKQQIGNLDYIENLLNFIQKQVLGSEKYCQSIVKKLQFKAEQLNQVKEYLQLQIQQKSQIQNELSVNYNTETVQQLLQVENFNEKINMMKQSIDNNQNIMKNIIKQNEQDIYQCQKLLKERSRSSSIQEVESLLDIQKNTILSDGTPSKSKQKQK